MQQPARNRESGQRLTREELAPSAGFGRLAEVGALATAASAMAIGALNAAEPKAPTHDEAARNVQQQSGNAEEAKAADTGTAGNLAPHSAPAGAAAEPNMAERPPEAGQATVADALMDPSALTARIAEQIASSVSDP